MKSQSRSNNETASIDRRSFFKTAGTVAAGAAAAMVPPMPALLSASIAGENQGGVLTRTLGRTGLKVSAIGLGTIPLFRAPRDQAVEVIKKSIDNGITFIDTARGYREGYSEECLGVATKGIRDKLVILSKSGNRTDKIADDVDKSLNALQTDFIDIYCFHSLDSDEQWKKVLGPNGALEALKRAKQAGKIRFIGMSGHRSDFLTECISTGELDVAVTPFNFVFDDAIYDLIPKAKEMNVGLAGIKPFGGGFIQYAELSLRWILQQQFDVTCPGMWQVDEVIQNTRILRDPQPLIATELEYLHEERQLLYYELCRFCNVCKPCPKGIPYLNIVMTPLMLRRQGLALELGERKQKKPLLNALDKIEQCDNCGTCINSCKYHLPIIDLMKNVKRQFYNPIKYYKV